MGYAGLAIGSGSVLLSIGAFFKLVSDPHYLVALSHAIVNARAGVATDDNWYALAQLAGAFIAIVGSTVLAVLASYVGRPAKLSETPEPPSPGQGGTKT